jgi:hypothetical protein
MRGLKLLRSLSRRNVDKDPDPIVEEPAPVAKRVPKTPEQRAARAARGAKAAAKVDAFEGTQAYAAAHRSVYRKSGAKVREREEKRYEEGRAAAAIATIERRKKQRVEGDSRRTKRLARRAKEAAASLEAQVVHAAAWRAKFYAVWLRRRQFRRLRAMHRLEVRAAAAAAAEGDLATARALKKKRRAQGGSLAMRMKAMANNALLRLGISDAKEEEVAVVSRKLSPEERALRMHRRLLRKAGIPRKYAKDLPQHREKEYVFLGAAAQAIEASIAHQRSEAFLLGRRDLLREPRDIVEARLKQVADYDVVDQYAARKSQDVRTIGAEDPEKPMVGFAPPVGKYSKSSGGEKYFHYEGEWDRGAMEGMGEFTFYDGRTYTGEWLSNRQHGAGVAKYAPYTRPANAIHNVLGGKAAAGKGAVYEGEWRDGKYHGRGVLTSVNGTKYDGDWIEGVKHGHGVQTYASGQEYEGGFEWGQREGHGVLMSSTGYSYAGAWSNGFIDGWGALILAADQHSDGVAKKQKSIVRYWERSTLRELVQMRHADAEWEEEDKKAEYKYLLAPLQEQRLQILIDKVRLSSSHFGFDVLMSGGLYVLSVLICCSPPRHLLLLRPPTRCTRGLRARSRRSSSA